MLFSEYYERIHGYTGDIRLVFEFKDAEQGLLYFLNEGGELTRYLDSPFVVRDRIALADNPVWNRYHEDFRKTIIVGYKGCWFTCHPGVWSPSVDAVLLIDTLLCQEADSIRDVRSVLDFGCGSGVMGIVLAKFSKGIKDLYLLDMNKAAILSSALNIIGNDLDDRVRTTLLTSMDDRHADIGIVTPYYFPVTRDLVPDPLETIVEAGRESARLVNEVARHSSTTYFVYSSTTEEHFLGSLECPHTVLEERLVPFTLGDNVSSRAFHETAVANGMLIRRDDSPFKYWHKIYVGKNTK